MNEIKKQQDLKGEKKLRILSLFSGCGGMDLGFEGGFIAPYKSVQNNPEWIEKRIDENWVILKKTSFEIVFANDILEEATLTWLNFMKDFGYNSSIYHTESIVDLTKKHEEGIFEFPHNIDIVVGGFPCQDFSVAGKRKGFNSSKSHDGSIADKDIPSEETRGKLYYWMKKVIDITKPKIFIAENVKGLVNLGHVKEIIQADFSNANNDGYIVLTPQVLHAGNYGVPESRERVFFIGIRKDCLKEGMEMKILESSFENPTFYPYPKPTHNCTINQEGLADKVILRDIFKDLKEPDCSSDPSQIYYSKAKYMGSHCQGQKEISLDKIGPTIRSEHHGNIEFRRLSHEHGGLNKEELEQGLKERRLTPRECALIQTFPPNYDFVIPIKANSKRFAVSSSKAYKVIGNAVPPILAYNIAMQIQSLWNNYFK